LIWQLSLVSVTKSFALAPQVAAAFLPAGPEGWILKHRAG
jgi:hypothetical protein